MLDRFDFILLTNPTLELHAPYGDGERFKRLFRETWKRLPLRVRRAVLKHWRGGPAPEVNLLPDWSGRQGEGFWDTATCQGTRLTFSWTLMDVAPDEAIRAVIAQELAKVYRLTIPSPSVSVLMKEWGWYDKAAA